MFDAIRKVLLLLVGLSLPLEGFATLWIGSYPIGLNKVATALLLAFALVTWPLSGRSLPWNRKHPWVLAFAVAVALGATQGLAKGLPGEALGQAATSFGAVILFYFLVVYTVRNEKDLGILLGSLALGAVVAVGYGAVLGGDFPEAGRYGGNAGNPNRLAYVVSAVLPLMFALFFSTRSLAVRGLLTGGIAIAVAGILFSLSRSAFLSCAAMGALWVVRFRSLGTIRYLLPILLLALGVTFLAPPDFSARLKTLSSEGRVADGSIQKRLLGDRLGLRAFFASPLIGQGLLGFGPWAHEKDPRIGRGHAVHHAYLAVAASFGLLGLIPFFVLTVLTWRDFSSVWRAARSRDLEDDPALFRLGRLALLLQISFFACIIGAQFHPTEREKAHWLLMGLSSTLVGLARSRVVALRGEHGTRESAAPAFGAFEESRDLAGRAVSAAPR